MNEPRDWIAWAATAISSVVVYAWGAAGWAYQLLFVAMATDVAMGLLCGWSTCSVSSERFGKGIARRGAVLLIGFMLTYFEGQASWMLGGLKMGSMDVTLPFDEAFLMYQVVREVLSVLENAAALGAPVPSWMRKRFERIGEALDRGEAV